MAKTYTVTRTHHRTGRTYASFGTVAELVDYHAYTLEKGASYSHEKGNAKVNRNPKNIESLVKNLNNAENNAAANGYSGYSYSARETTSTETA